MEVATADQLPSRHQKRYVPIVAGTLGGCGLALIVVFLFYLFLRRRRRRYGRRGRLYRAGSRLQTQSWRNMHEVMFDRDLAVHSLTTEGAERIVVSQRGESSPGETLDEVGVSMYQGIPVTIGNLSGETEDPWDWNSNFDPSGLGELPFANVGLQTNFDLDHQNPDASTMQASSRLEPSRETGFPLDIDLGLGIPVDWDSNFYLSDSRALPFVSPDLQTSYDLDHQDPSTTTVPANLDLVTSHITDSLAGINNSNRTSQQGVSSNPLPAPFAPTSIPSSVLPLSSLRTDSVPSISPSQFEAPQHAYQPLPRAPNLRCPNCPRKFSSRFRLELVP